MKVKRDTKFEEEWICHYKIGIRNLTNFDLNTESLKNVQYNGLLLNKVYIVSNKKVQGVIFHENEEGYKNLERN